MSTAAVSPLDPIRDDVIRLRAFYPPETLRGYMEHVFEQALHSGEFSESRRRALQTVAGLAYLFEELVKAACNAFPPVPQPAEVAS